MDLTKTQKYISCFNHEFISTKLLFSLLIWSNVQTTCLIFSIISPHITNWNSSFVDTIARFITVDSLNPSLTSIFQFSYHVCVLYLIVVITFFLLLGLFIYLKVEFRILKTICQFLGCVHFKFLYLPMLNILTYFLISSKDGTILQLWKISSSTKDNYLYITIILVTLNIILQAFLSFFCFSFSFNKFTSRLPSSIEFFRSISKSALLIHNLINNYDTHSQSNDSLLIILIAEVCIISILLLNCPDFDRKLTRVRFGFISINLSLIAIYFLRDIVKQINFSTFFAWIMILLVFFNLPKLFINHGAEFIFDQVLNTSNQSRSIQRITYLSHVINLDPSSELIYSAKSSQYLISMGLLKVHRPSCKSQTCFCRAFDSQDSEKVSVNELNEAYQTYIVNSILEFTKKLIEDTKKNVWLKIIYANFLLSTHPNLYPKALLVLYSIREEEKNFFTNTAIQQIINMIRKIIQINSLNVKNEVDIQRYIDYKAASDKLKNEIKQSINLTLKFWNANLEENPKFTSIFNYGRSSNHQDEKLENLWKELNDIYKVFLVDDCLIYGAYKIIMRSNRSQGAKLLKSYTKRLSTFFYLADSRVITNETLIDIKNIFFTVSLERDKLGQILEVQGNSFGAFGYNPKELKGQNIDLIMPDYIKVNHNQYILNHIETGTTKIIYKNKNLLAEHKKKYLVPVCAYVCPSPSIDEGLKYLGILRPYTSVKETMLISKDGDIYAMTKELQSDLKVEMESHSNHSIIDFCPMFESIIQMIDTYEWIQKHINEKEKEKFEVLMNKMKGNLIDDYENSGRIIIPDNEDDYLSICKIYEQIVTDGLNLCFFIGESYIKYNCHLYFDPEAHTGEFRHISMYKIEIGHESRAQLSRSSKTDLRTRLGFKQTIARLIGEKRYSIAHNKVSGKSKSKNSVLSGHAPPKVKFESAYLLQKIPEKTATYDFIQFEEGPSDPNKTTDPNLGENVVENLKNNLQTIENAEFISKSSEMQSNVQNFDQYNYILNVINQTTASAAITASIYGSEASVKSKAETKSLEYKINEITEDTKINNFGKAISFFYLLVIIMSFYFYFYSKDCLDVIHTTLLGISASSKRFQAFLKFAQAVRKIDALHHEILDYNYIGSHDEFKKYENELIYTEVKKMLEYTPAIENTYSVLDPDDILEIMAPVLLAPPEDEENKISISFEGAFSLLESLGVTIALAGDKNVDLQQDQVLNYVFDDVLIRFEESFDVFMDHLQERIDSIQAYLVYFLISQTIAIAILEIVFIIFNKRNLDYQNGIVEAIVKIDPEKYDIHILRIENYHKLLKEEKIVKTRLNKSHMSVIHSQKVGKKEKKQRYRRYEQINILASFLKRVIFQSLLFGGLILGALVFLLQVNNMTEIIRSFSIDFTFNTKISAKYLIIINAIDNYVFEEDDTLRGEEINPGLWNEISYLQNYLKFNQEFSLIGSYQNSVDEIIQSNICARYADQIESIDDCLKIADGSLRFGFTGMLSFILESTKDLLRLFDRSNRTEEDVKMIYEQKSYYELFYLSRKYLDLPFDEIEDVIQGGIDEYDVKNREFVITMDIIYLVLACAVGYLSQKIYNHLKSEKFESRRLMCLLPAENILESPYLLRYL